MRKTFLFLILLIPTLYAQDIGLTYNETTNVYDLYNEYNHFYVNASSGFQITNVIDEYWSQNYICINVYDELGTHEKCENEMEFFWVSDTDNEFYSQLVGGSIFEIENYSFMFSITYFLYKNESEIKITPSLINTGPDVNLSISWKVDDIKIGNTYGDDYFSYINNDSVITYPLNNLTLNLNNSEMQESIYYLNEQTSGDWISTRWNYSNSNLSLYTEENNTVIYLNLNKESLLYGEEISTDIWWLDAICGWSCDLNAPLSHVSIQEGELFDLNLSVSWLGTCTSTGSFIKTRFNNGTWNYMSTSGTNLFSVGDEVRFVPDVLI